MKCDEEALQETNSINVINYVYVIYVLVWERSYLYS